MPKIQCNLTQEQRLSKKMELLGEFNLKMVAKHARYERYIKHLRLGLMLKNWCKSGSKYAVAGDYVLYYKTTGRSLDIDGKPSNLSVWTSHQFTIGDYPQKFGGDTFLVTRDAWVLDCDFGPAPEGIAKG